MSDPVWLDDLSILYKTDRLTEVFPMKEMSKSERINALSRLIIYVAGSLFMYNPHPMFLYAGILILMVLGSIIKISGRKEKFEEEHCIRPSRYNPFMNVLMSDYTDNPNRDPACKLSTEINKEIEEHFNYNLYKNTDDLFNKNNSQRQFYTNPSTTIPNDQDSFSKWLYKSQETCKQDTTNCIRSGFHERLQQNKFIFPDPERNPSSEDIR